MALTKGVNSYATVEEADAFFEDRLDSTKWVEASPLRKAQALITATTMVDSMSFLGYVADEAQTLAFPRDGMYLSARLGMVVSMKPDVPSEVITAVYEQALHLLSNKDVRTAKPTVDGIDVGPIKISNPEAAPPMPRHVKRGLGPLLLNQGGWWRAN